MIIIIIAIILLIKAIYNPKIDITSEDEILLYYGNDSRRKYIKLWQK
jgi:hypothetical protein